MISTFFKYLARKESVKGMLFKKANYFLAPGQPHCDPPISLRWRLGEFQLVFDSDL